jgi:hypothetical protein
MGVIREEYAHLGEVVRRYQATGTMDAVLSEVERGWDSELELGWSSVSTTSKWRRRLIPLEGGADDGDTGDSDLSGPAAERDSGSDPGAGSAQSPERVLSRFVLDRERSAVLIDARSTVGPISFGTIGVEGSVYAEFVDGAVNTDVPPTGWLTVDVTGFSSGNKLYDAELQRRIDSRRFPTARVELRGCAPSAPGLRYRLQGEMTFHGISRLTEGTVCVDSVSEDRIVIRGEQVFDIRDFAVPSPTMLMLRIFPDVRIRLHAEAERADA